MDNSSIEIVNGSRVTLHFSLSLSAEEVIDSTFEREPANLHIGDGNMLPGFEKLLLGLKKGSEVETIILAKEAFGERNPRNVQRFSIEKSTHLLEDELMPTEKGSVVAFKDSAGFDVPGVVLEILDATIIVDFNHPLSGKDILFKALILGVGEPDVEAIEIKL